jgi:choline kinase
MARLTERELIDITRHEVAWYAGNAVDAKSYFIEDIKRQIFIVTSIPDDPNLDKPLIVNQARVVDNLVIIDADNVWDKQLWKALEKAGVPREQIIRAYIGEKVPEASGA